MTNVQGALNREVRKRRRAEGPLDVRQVADRIESFTGDALIKWTPWYGNLQLAWVGVGTKRAEQKFGLISRTVIPALLADVDPDYFVDVDIDEDRHDSPLAINFAKPGADPQFIEVEMTARRLRIGNTWVSMADPTCGRRVIRILANHVGAYFGRSRAAH